MTIRIDDTAAVPEIEKQLVSVDLQHCDDLKDPDGKPPLPEKGLARLVHPDIARAFFSNRPSGKVEMLIDSHFDLNVDVLIKDAELATLGLVHVVTETLEDRARQPLDLDKWCRQRVDEAVYLRHVLLTLTRNTNTQPRPLAYSVELTLAFPSERENQRMEAGRVLRELIREGSFLHAIGVSLWRLGTDPVHEALPWLLSATRSANKELETYVFKDSPFRSNSFGPLTLDNFRLPLKRVINFDLAARFHLIHGPNGSGKSAIVEGIELGMTGKIARLGKPDKDNNDYAHILQNRDVNAPAKIQLPGFEDAKMVEVLGITSPLENRLNANSFRLNQDLSDRLAAASSGERAATFVEAFFPDKTDGLQSRRSAIAAFEEAWKAVPAWARVEATDPSEPTAIPKTPTVLRQLTWIGGTSIQWERVVQALRKGHGLTAPAELDGKLLKDAARRLQETGTNSWDKTLSYAGEIDTALGALRTDIASLRLPAAISLLEELGSRTLGEHAVYEGDIPRLFNDWLEATAEADLARRLRDVAETIRLAGKSNPKFEIHGELDTLLGALTKKWSEPAWKAIAVYPTRLADRAAELRKGLSGTRPPGATGSAGQPDAPSMKPLQDFSFDALDNAASSGLLGEQFEHCQPPLGQAVKTAFERSRVVEVVAGGSTYRIGESGWASAFLNRLQTERSTYESLSGALSRVDSLSNGLNALFKLRETAQAVESGNSEAELVLDKLMNGNLLNALNEVKALLTPARWAYHPLRAKMEGTANKLDLLDADNVSIAQRLNTAELNVTALAFFFLYARRIENPLRLLILDDPLQNMDEMTVATVARAVTKLLRLWDVIEPKSPDKDIRWRVLMLLHSEDDVERFRNEVPCAYYRLPWLRPTGKASDKDKDSDNISPESALLTAEAQSLKNVIGEISDSNFKAVAK